MKPFLGYWKEISIKDQGRELLGTLEFNMVPERCTFNKKFELAGNDHGYVSQITLEQKTGVWREVFNGFSRFDWKVEGTNTYMVNLNVELPEGHKRRNLWLPVNDDEFHIIVEHSEDNGATWSELSRYVVERL